ncbi:MAG TPA: hypothetical protein VGQ76_21000 [Thermoanaerobaculia bacterium]|nr:hypothetical protein [Thermoanaerobaculia bacterium]
MALSRRSATLLAALLVLMAYAWAFFTLMARRESDISRFVVAGSVGVDPERIPAGLSIFPDVPGYDGIAFYRLALDPFTREATDFGITLDNPPYRQQRVLYPLIVHVLSPGHPEWVPTLMVLVNLTAVVVLTIIAARLTSPFWSLLIALYPGFFIAFSRNTCEIVVLLFAVSAVAAFTRKRWGLATLLLCCAVLTRETTLVLALSLAAVYGWQLLRRRERDFPAITFIGPGVVYGTWQLVLRSWWGVTGFEAGRIDAAIPFSSYARNFAESLPRRTELMRTHFAECIFWFAVVCAVIFVFRRTKVAPQWRVAWIAYLGLASILAWDVWGDQMSFMRVLGDLYVVSALILLGTTSRMRWPMLIGAVSLSFYVVLHMR